MSTRFCGRGDVLGEDLLAYRGGDGPEQGDSIAVTAADVEMHHISASEAP